MHVKHTILRCNVQSKQNQVLIFNSFLNWLTLVKRMILQSHPIPWLIYCVHGLHAMPFLNFYVAFFFLKNFINLHAAHGGHLWIALNLLKYFSFYSKHMHVLTIMLLFDHNHVFVFHPLFCFSYGMTIKPINRTKGVISSADSPHSITSLTKK